jgi:acetyl-CoA carboxylase biotin carboxyl carrier protein
MANPTGSGEENPFDMARIRQLVRLMRDNELSEIDLRWEGSRLRLRRGPEGVVVPQWTSAPAIGAAPQPAPAGTSQSSSGDGGAPAKVADSHLTTINSPIVGTFYAASGPDVGPFVTVGSRVSPDTTVCIIEAMKVFNEIPASLSGTVREILVENGAPVEYGQPLFRVEP